MSNSEAERDPLVVAFNNLEGFSKFQPDWDSYGASIISPGAISMARDFLLRLKGVLTEDEIRKFPPWSVPSPNGGVQLAWSALGHYLEVEFDTQGRIKDYFLVKLVSGGKDKEEEKQQPTPEEVVDIIARIVRSAKD